MTPIIPGLPNLPPLPTAPGDFVRWAAQMTRATQDAYRILANRIEQLILVGTLAERPAANDTRRYYFTPNELTADPPTGTLYFDDGTWVPVTGGAGSAPFVLAVREVDLTPTVTPVTTLEFDQADGFVVSDQGSGVARVNIDVVGAGCPPPVEVPDGDINGTNRDYDLSQTPPCSGILVYDRIIRVPECDYTLVGAHIKYAIGLAPQVGHCHYWIYL